MHQKREKVDLELTPRITMMMGDEKMNFSKKKVLIAYFSKKGENWYLNGLTDLAKGNTEIFAETIAKLTGGDLFEIEAKKAYPDSYKECCDVAKDEYKAKARPELLNHHEAKDYDVIFVGWPCWWGTMPMPVYTWLEEVNRLSGKIAIPFETNEGSGWGKGEKDFALELKEAKVMPGLQMRGHEVKTAEASIKKWLENL